MVEAMTHHVKPAAGERAFNAVVRWLVNRGVNLAGAQSLAVTGRASGRMHTTPVNPIRIDGREYLVSPRGDTQWSRNVKVTPSATLRRGRRVRAVVLHEVADRNLKAAVLADYLRRWGWEVGRFLPQGLTPKSDLATIREYVDVLPVFAVDAA